MAPELRRGPHVFVDDLDEPRLAPDDDHHLRRVLRTRVGDGLTASDGRGWWRVCVVTDGGLEVVGERQLVPAPDHEVVVAVAPTKGDRPEWAVQKLTELGVDRIVVLRTERTVVRWDGARRQRQAERFERIARAAAMQSRWCRLPSVEIGAALHELAGQLGAGLAVADPDGGPLADEIRAVAVGPEGGWGRDDLRDVSAPMVRLGDAVLRSETAAVAAGALLCARRAGVVG